MMRELSTKVDGACSQPYLVREKGKPESGSAHIKERVRDVLDLLRNAHLPDGAEAAQPGDLHRPEAIYEGPETTGAARPGGLTSVECTLDSG